MNFSVLPIHPQSALQYESDTRENVAVYFAWDLSFTLVAILLVASVIFTVVRSRIWMVEENKMQVLHLFVGIPPPFLRSFEKSCALRMRRLEREREAFMYGGANGLDLGDDEPDETTATGMA